MHATRRAIANFFKPRRIFDTRRFWRNVGVLGFCAALFVKISPAMQTIRLRTHKRSEMVNITAEVTQLVAHSGVKRGWCLIHAPHTTAAIAVQEGYDPDVARDILVALDELVPWESNYHHAEGNSAAHIKSLMTGAGETLPIE